MEAVCNKLSESEVQQVWEIAEKAVKRICNKHRNVDEQVAFDVATTAVQKVIADIASIRVMDSYAGTLINSRLQTALKTGRLTYGSKWATLPDGDDERDDVIDHSASSEIEAMEMEEVANRLDISSDEWMLLEKAVDSTRTQSLSSSERKQLERLRQRVKVQLDGML